MRASAAAWAAALAGAAAVLAQGPPAAVYVRSPEPRIVAGSQVQLAAAARDVRGAARSGDTFTWNSSDSSVLAVDQNGLVTAGMPGIADVTAAVGNARGAARIQVLPSRIVVAPERSQILIGETIQYAAAALDANGQPIPGVAFQWQMTGANGGTTVAATLDRGGLLTARANARITVRAVLPYAGAGGNFVTQSVGLAQVEIRPRADYRLTRLLASDDARGSLQLRPRRTSIAVGENGQVALVGGLDGLSNGVLLYQDGRMDLLAGAGQPTPLGGSLVWDFGDPAINSRGQVLVRADHLNAGPGLILASRGEAGYILLSGQSAGGIGDLRNFLITRYSLNNRGQALLRADYRASGSEGSVTGLFTYSDGGLQLEWSAADPLPGLPGRITFESEFGIDSNGALYFRAFNGTARAIYRKEGFSAPARVIGSGDALADSTVRNVGQVAVAAGGDLVFAGDLANNQQFIARYASGNVSRAPEVLALQNFRSLYAAHSTAGVLFYGDAGSGLGLYRWTSSGVATVLLRGRPSPGGAPVTDFLAGGLTAQGDAIVQARTGDSPMAVLRLGSSDRVLFRAGDPVEASANLVFRAPLPGGHAGPAHVLMGGNQASLFEIGSRGPLPRLLLGDALPGGAPYTGTLPVRESGSGDLYVSADEAVYRLSGTSADALFRFPLRAADGVLTYAPFLLAVSDSGAMAWVQGTNDNHSRLAVISGGQPTAIAFLGNNPRRQTPSPAGGAFLAANELAVDDNGRVMAILRANGGPTGCFLYARGEWRATLVLDSSSIGGLEVNGVRELKAAGGAFYALLTQRGGGSVLARFEDQEWTPLLARGDPLPNGNSINGFNTFDVNRRGDVAFSANANGPTVLALYSGGDLRLVHLSSQPAADGDYFRSYDAIVLHDDRRVYFTGMDLLDRYLLYVADPLF